MDRQSHYYRQVQLLLQIIPFVAQHDCFALKGGTAINLFVRDFPRLSVDIDLVFLPMMDRQEALQTIKDNLNTLVHIPEQSGHRFRHYPDSHSAINRTLILR